MAPEITLFFAIEQLVKARRFRSELNAIVEEKNDGRKAKEDDVRTKSVVSQYQDCSLTVHEEVLTQTSMKMRTSDPSPWHTLGTP